MSVIYFPKMNIVRAVVSESTDFNPTHGDPARQSTNDPEPRPVTDSQACRAARRAGYVLRKSRRAVGIDNLGGYMIVDPSTNFGILGWQYDLSAEAVVDYFKD